MITKFKIFENLSELPKVGDYVYLNIDEYTDKTWRNFIISNIAEIIKIETEHGGLSDMYKIKFENVPDEILKDYLYRDGSVKARIERFKYWSSDKNELETKINSEKYNL